MKVPEIRQVGDELVLHLPGEPDEELVQRVRTTTDISAILWPGGAIGLPT